MFLDSRLFQIVVAVSALAMFVMAAGAPRGLGG